jgi:acetyl-CoA acetyltransferase
MTVSPPMAHVPYGAYWSTPFAKWQGELAHLHALEFAAHVTRHALAARGIPPEVLDHGVLGMTVPQRSCFYGLPWLAGMIGAPHVGGPTIMQACATSARCVQAAAHEVAGDNAGVALVVTADRVSNGPHLYYPAPHGPGGTGQSEDWVLGNFGGDPYAGVSMVQTAENVARRFQITTAQQHDVVLRRYAQYGDAVADDRAFQRRYITLPLAVPDASFRRTVAELAGDAGVHPTSEAALARLRPVQEGGTVTYGGQTHPADGNAGMIVTNAARAAELSREPRIAITLHGFGLARTEKAHMPMAPIPAARRALDAAGIGIADVDAVKSHNPFAVNDIAFARETGFPLGRMNNFGCSLIFGHPQGPTGLRLMMELIEELAARGGGWGLFHGCAAGDTGMAAVLRVDDRRG